MFSVLFPVTILLSRLVLSLHVILAEAVYASRDIMQCGFRD